MKKRGLAAAYVVVAPINTAQPCNLRSSLSEIWFDVHVCMQGNTHGRMDPEPGQLESSSAGTGFEKPGQQCLPNWEMGRTTVDGCLLVGVSSILGGDIFPPEELIIGLPKDKESANEENEQFDPGGKGKKPPF